MTKMPRKLMAQVSTPDLQSSQQKHVHVGVSPMYSGSSSSDQGDTGMGTHGLQLGSQNKLCFQENPCRTPRMAGLP
jgi:hypothetical protein